MIRVWYNSLKDISEAVTDIENFVLNVSVEDFVSDRMRRNAVVGSLEVNGEILKNRIIINEFKKLLNLHYPILVNQVKLLAPCKRKDW